MMNNQVLLDHMQDARDWTLALFGEIDDADLIGPELPMVNPPLWEVAHVGWFWERWILRHCGGQESLITARDPDPLYNSAVIEHHGRWETVLLARGSVLDFLSATHARCAEVIEAGGQNPKINYFAQLSLFHEDMHVESLLFNRQTLGYARPKRLPARPEELGNSDPRIMDVAVKGGTVQIGAPRDGGFVFDNEKWQHAVVLDDFKVSCSATNELDFAEFVNAGGYGNRELWCEDGWAWRQGAAAEHPVYWRGNSASGWEVREFETWRPLRGDLPVMHVNWYEAQAWCRWAGRRLPTEAEWETACKQDLERGENPATHMDLQFAGTTPAVSLPGPARCKFMHGNVWEWTDTTFEPFEDFSMDPYQEYSEPWFGTHKVQRGGCFTTRSRMMRTTLRNFLVPQSRDRFSGFRSCPL